METIKIIKKPFILKNKDFKTIQIKIMFPFNNSVDNLAIKNIIYYLLQFRNAKYPEERLLLNEKKKKYILDSYMGCTSFADIGFLCIDFCIPTKEALNKDILDEQFEFLHNFIYNPYLENGLFSEADIEREIKNLNIDLDNSLNSVRPYHSFRLDNLCDDEGLYSRCLLNHRELIDKLNNKDLYNFYTETTKNIPLVFIMGDVEPNEIERLLDKYIYLDGMIEKDVNFKKYYFLKPRKDIVDVVEDSDFKDSALSFVYKVKDMSEDDIIPLRMVNSLLSNSSSGLLNNKLRNDNNLVYSSYSHTPYNYGILSITAYINKDSVELAKESIKEVINDLKDKSITEKLIENIKEKCRISILKDLDNKFCIFNDFIDESLGISLTTPQYYEKIKNITSEDISKFVDRLVLDTVYFLKEGDHE